MIISGKRFTKLEVQAQMKHFTLIKKWKDDPIEEKDAKLLPFCSGLDLTSKDGIKYKQIS